jgi:hypothetical protein
MIANGGWFGNGRERGCCSCLRLRSRDALLLPRAIRTRRRPIPQKTHRFSHSSPLVHDPPPW